MLNTTIMIYMKHTFVDSLSLVEEFESLEESEDEVFTFGELGYVGAGTICDDVTDVASTGFCWELELHESSSLILKI